MKTASYWLESAARPKFRPLTRSITVDVLVAGAGVTGILTAYLLKKAGLRVALLERERVATRDTGHTTAHLTHVTDARLHKLVKSFGRSAAQATWDAGSAAIDEIENIVFSEGIDCEYSRVPGYLHAPVSGGQSDERAALKKDAALANEFGFDAAYLDSVPFMRRPGVRFSNQAKFHPVKFLAALARIVHGGSVQIFENSAVTEFDAKKKRAKANKNWINYGRVVLATHNPLAGETGLVMGMLFQTKLALYSSYVVGAKVPYKSIPIASFWDTADPYSYLRVDRHQDFDYAIFGGRDHKTGTVSNTQTVFKNLAGDFLKIAPEAKIDYRWSGQVIETPDGLPYIGPNEDDQFLATGYSGNGFTFGTIAGMMARDWITGVKNPWADLFAPERKKIRGSILDYLRENKDYPYYMLRDRLRAAEGKSVRTVERNEGKVLRLGGKKVAVYRDAGGQVKKLSPVCTHMGCVVHWNKAEKTWDCPCHGSRFHPDGKVLGGPAETPLASA